MLLNSLSPSMALFCLMAALLLAFSAQAAPAVEKMANGVTADNEKLLAVEKASNSHVPSHVPGVHRMKVRRVKLPADHPLLKQQQKNGIGHFFGQLAKKGGAPAPGEEILPVTQDVWGILGVVDIQLGTPPQEFTFWLDPNSPDMFVLSEDVVDVQGRELTDERNEFNPRRSKSFSDASSRPWSQTCEGAAFAFSGNECMVASGRNATDMLRIGELARKMNFGLVDRVDVMQSGYKETTAFPDFFGIDGKLGLSGMRPTSGIPSALEQLEPLMVQPMFTFFTYPDDFTETELVLGSDEIEGRCASMDYQHFPVTQLSAGPTAARHAWLQSVGIKYTGENATNSRVFRTGAWFAFYQMTPYSEDRAGSIPIYGPEWAVRQIANGINGTSTFGEGFYTLPCDVRHLSSPSIVLTFGGRGQPSGQWTLRPKDYVLGPYKDSKSCYLAFTYNKGVSQDFQGPQDAWFSWEQHTGFCVNYNFQAGTMGIATPTF